MFLTFKEKGEFCTMVIQIQHFILTEIMKTQCHAEVKVLKMFISKPHYPIV